MQPKIFSNICLILLLFIIINNGVNTQIINNQCTTQNKDSLIYPYLHCNFLIKWRYSIVNLQNSFYT